MMISMMVSMQDCDGEGAEGSLDPSSPGSTAATSVYATLTPSCPASPVPPGQHLPATTAAAAAAGPSTSSHTLAVMSDRAGEDMAVSSSLSHCWSSGEEDEGEEGGGGAMGVDGGRMERPREAEVYMDPPNHKLAAGAADMVARGPPSSDGGSSTQVGHRFITSKNHSLTDTHTCAHTHTHTHTLHVPAPPPPVMTGKLVCGLQLQSALDPP